MNKTSADSTQHQHPDDFDELVKQMGARVTLLGDQPVFKTNARSLWELYLNSFQDPATRQYYNCDCCHDFIRKYGDLAVIDSDGYVVPLLADVDMIFLRPSMWNGGFNHQGNGVILRLKDAKETVSPSLCLFPEMLRSELHGVRSVIEAHSRSRKIEIPEGPTVTGLALKSDMQISTTLRVTSQGNTQDYLIDRWD